MYIETEILVTLLCVISSFSFTTKCCRLKKFHWLNLFKLEAIMKSIKLKGRFKQKIMEFIILTNQILGNSKLICFLRVLDY